MLHHTICLCVVSMCWVFWYIFIGCFGIEMKKIDSQRLIICDLQSELFVKSRTLECSSEIFIRRFMNSKIVKLYDNEQIKKKS